MKFIFALVFLFSFQLQAQTDFLRNERGVPIENEKLGYIRPLIKSMNESYYHPQARISEIDLAACQISKSELQRQFFGLYLGNNNTAGDYVSHSLILIRESSRSNPQDQRWSYFIAQSATHLNSGYGFLSATVLNQTLANSEIFDSESEILNSLNLESQPLELLEKSTLIQKRMHLWSSRGYELASAPTYVPINLSSNEHRCAGSTTTVLLSWRLKKASREEVVLLAQVKNLGAQSEVTLLNPFLFFSSLSKSTEMIRVNSLGKF